MKALRWLWLSILLHVPVVLLWALCPRSWPRYILLSATLGLAWALSYSFLLALMQVLLRLKRLVHRGSIFASGIDELRFLEARTRWSDNPTYWLLHRLPLTLFTLSYPALMINVGEIPGTDSWSLALRLVPATLIPGVVIIGYLIFPYNYYKIRIKRNIRSRWNAFKRRTHQSNQAESSQA